MCGILGVVATTPVNQLLYDGLQVLQHRGQDAAGIATAEGGRFHMHKGSGLVRDVFRTRNMRSLPGNWGIGHCATRPPARPTTPPRRSPSTSTRPSA
jgi:amidophosphoribosyltransferase